MKTDELINALVADLAPSKLRFRQIFSLALLASGILAAVVFFASLRIRPDMGAAIASPRLWVKFAVTLSLVAAGTGLVPRLGTPGASSRPWGWALLAGPAVLALAVIVELLVSPASSWAARMIGVNAFYCVTLIPMISLGPLACLLFALRQGAPSNPGLAGAAAGLLASSIAAALYALHCTDDSPLFGAAWYSLAMALVTLAGYAIGSRWLRW